MAIKILKITGLLIILLSLTGCPEDENCYDIDRIATVDNLMTLTPLRSQYNQGDVIILKFIVPANNSFYGYELDLLEETGDDEAFLLTAFGHLFSGNQLTFIKGSQGEMPNWYSMLYNHVTDNYEFELQITLTKLGHYSLHGLTDVTFQGSSKCNRFRLNSNVEGWDSEGKINFLVE